MGCSACVRDKVIKLLGQLVFLLVQDGLHCGVFLRLRGHARQVSVQVTRQFFLGNHDEHAADAAELDLLGSPLLDLLHRHLSLFLLVGGELDLAIDLPALLNGALQLNRKLLQLCLIHHLKFCL